MSRLVFAILVILAIPVSSQDYEVKVTEVTVWVKAIDRSGKAIPGLTQDAFEIYEDGKKMTPTCFEEFVTSSGLPASQTQPSSPSKRIVLILDLYNMQQAEYLFIKPKIVEFLNEIAPRWEAMLVAVIPGVVEVNVPFTSDVKQLQAKLDQISANSVRDMDVLNKRRWIQQLLGSRQREKAYGVAHEYSLEEKMLAKESLKALGKFEKDLVKFKQDSHLVVLYISGGINSNPGKQYFDLIEGQDNSGFSLRESGTDIWSTLRKMVAQLNRHNITFYTLHSRGFVDPVSNVDRNWTTEDRAYLRDTQDILAELADTTGGLYFENSLNFRRGFDLILNDLDHQYLICYKAPPHDKPDEIHKIKVKTKQSGVKLRHRSGYID